MYLKYASAPLARASTDDAGPVSGASAPSTIVFDVTAPALEADPLELPHAAIPINAHIATEAMLPVFISDTRIIALPITIFSL
jgi:hypothetical protein